MTREIVIVTFISLLGGLIILAVTKAALHFDYLKKVFSKDFQDYKNILEPKKLKFIDEKRDLGILLLFPFFKRFQHLETNTEQRNLAKTIKSLCKIIKYLFYIFIVFIITLIVVFGEFN